MHYYLHINLEKVQSIVILNKSYLIYIHQVPYSNICKVNLKCTATYTNEINTRWYSIQYLFPIDIYIHTSNANKVSSVLSTIFLGKLCCVDISLDGVRRQCCIENKLILRFFFTKEKNACISYGKSHGQSINRTIYDYCANFAVDLLQLGLVWRDWFWWKQICLFFCNGMHVIIYCFHWLLRIMYT